MLFRVKSPIERDTDKLIDLILRMPSPVHSTKEERDNFSECESEKQLVGVMAHLNEIEDKLKLLAKFVGCKFETKPAVPAQPEKIELIKIPENQEAKPPCDPLKY